MRDAQSLSGLWRETSVDRCSEKAQGHGAWPSPSIRQPASHGGRVGVEQRSWGVAEGRWPVLRGMVQQGAAARLGGPDRPGTALDVATCLAGPLHRRAGRLSAGRVVSLEPPGPRSCPSQWPRAGCKAPRFSNRHDCDGHLAPKLLEAWAEAVRWTGRSWLHPTPRASSRPAL